jgi:hypothetical protein
MDIGLPLLGLIVFILIVAFRKLKPIKKSRPWLFWAVIFVFCFLFLFGANEFLRREIGGFAGSYPYVEYWHINAPETEVIEAIKELKKEDPSLQPPNQTELTSKRDTGYNWNTIEMIEYNEKLLKDSSTPLPEHNYGNTYTDYWLYVDFYYADTKQVVHTWTRPDFDSTITTFAFVSISSFDNPQDSKLVNKDFWYIENKRQINKFKRLIVDRIKAKIEKKKSGT